MRAGGGRKYAAEEVEEEVEVEVEVEMSHGASAREGGHMSRTPYQSPQKNCAHLLHMCARGCVCVCARAGVRVCVCVCPSHQS